MDKVGMRVGAVLCTTKTEVMLLGYGTYQGDHVPPGMSAPAGLPPLLNPKIVLDDGDVVWGYQCWWDAEDNVRKSIGPRTVKVVDLDGNVKERA